MFDTDDEDFIPSSSANLSSIFNGNALSQDNASLSYKAPKQPKALGSASIITTGQSPENKAPTQLQSSVVFAKVISLWKLENGQNRLLGKHIVAIIGNIDQNLYEVIVYQEKTNILIRQPLNDTLTLYKYPKHFMGIFDSQKQFWNLGFDTPENQETFLKEISKYNCEIIEKSPQTNDNDQVDNLGPKNSNDPVEKRKTESLVDKKDLDQGHTDDDSKSKILLRITKMGRQILPKPDMERKTSTDLSDSETESNNSDPRPQKPTTAPRKFRQSPNQEKSLSTPLMPERHTLQSNFTTNTNNMLLDNTQMVLNPRSMMYTPPYTDYGVNNFIIAQNTELRANLAEINLKLNAVLGSQSVNKDKNGNNEDCDSLKSRIKCLNLKIDNLTTDLERSRQMLDDLRKKYDLKCSEVIKEQEKQERWTNLNEEVTRLKGELCNMEALRAEHKHLDAIINEKDKLLESQKLRLVDTENCFIENQRLNENFEAEISEMNLQIEDLTLKTKNYEEKLTEKEKLLNDVRQGTDLKLNKEILNKKVKEIMNEAFRTIMERFDENELHNFKTIQKVVLDNLKKTTYSLINSVS